MSAKVILTGVKGPMNGCKYRFDERMLCLIGRAENCALQITGSDADGVSRHHCMLDVQPPKAFLQDLGSINGTFLNGRNIGRVPGQPNQEIHSWELATDDVIQIGLNFFRIDLFNTVDCVICHQPIDASNQSDSQPKICKQCMNNQKIPPEKGAKNESICRHCKRSYERKNKYDDHLCPTCLPLFFSSTRTAKLSSLYTRGSNMLHIPGYHVVRQIGRGGMGAVYLAQDLKSQEKVALKILLPDIAANDQCREDFVRETQNLRALKHPNIIEFKDCNYSGDVLYLVLEYCTYGTLNKYMKEKSTPLTLDFAVSILFQILDALEYAHSANLNQVSSLDGEEYSANGIVHRDIKPDNIFLTESPEHEIQAKIADFGISKAFDLAGLSGCTRTGDFSGTLGFIPKQQFLNFKYVKPEVDVWAAAATFFYMLTRKPPRNFSIGEITDVFERPPDSLSDYRGDVSPALSHLIDDVLDDREVLKYKSATALKHAIMQVLY